MEYLQVFDENKKMLNEKIERDLKKTLTGNKFFMVILLFIENSEGKFLLQKTSEARNSEIATTGGHVTFGDDGFKTTLKEAKEELGLTLNPMIIAFDASASDTSVSVIAPTDALIILTFKSSILIFSKEPFNASAEP